MPNPLAHPAASIPFTRAGLIFSALLLGSFSPDLGYLVLHISYLDSRPPPFFMNTASGLVLFDVPAAFVLLWLFHTLLKWPLLSLLPESLQRRLFKPAQGFSFAPLQRFGLILLSLFVGSLTHVIWDSFTHEEGWTVKHVPFLSAPISGLPLYAILQNLGSLLGIILLTYWALRWLDTAPQSDQLPCQVSPKARFTWFGLATISLAVLDGPIFYSRLMTGSRLIGEHFLMDRIFVLPVLIISLFIGIYCVTWMIVFNKNVRSLNSNSPRSNMLTK